MKTTHLPPVRVAPSVREEVENCLRDGESLSQFIEKAVVDATRARKAQDEFLARGRASLARAERTGEYYDAADVLGQMRGRLEKRMAAARKTSRSTRRS